MKKLNVLLGISITTLLLTLTLQPAAAQAEQIMAHTTGDTLSMVFALTLTPLWIVVGKMTKKSLGE